MLDGAEPGIVQILAYTLDGEDFFHFPGGSLDVHHKDLLAHGAGSGEAFVDGGNYVKGLCVIGDGEASAFQHLGKALSKHFLCLRGNVPGDIEVEGLRHYGKCG